jgi:hypothetical protein
LFGDLYLKKKSLPHELKTKLIEPPDPKSTVSKVSLGGEVTAIKQKGFEAISQGKGYFL